MKNSYQQFVSSFSRESRNLHITLEDNFKIYLKEYEENRSDKQLRSNMHCALLRYMVASGDSIHFFVSDDSFLDWIIDCSPELTADDCDPIGDHCGGKRVGVFHFPSNSKYRSFAVYVWTTAKVGDIKEMICLSAKNKFHQYAEIPLGGMGFISSGDYDCDNAVRIANGLGKYLSCFPEMLKSGPPDDVKHPSHHQYGYIKTIGISTKIQIYNERGDMTPHFRRGHFRVLRSGYFINKQFQVVFVKQCFVKGEAATILSPEEGNSH